MVDMAQCDKTLRQQYKAIDNLYRVLNLKTNLLIADNLPYRKASQLVMSDFDNLKMERV